jgi:hypothetical protein
VLYTGLFPVDSVSSMLLSSGGLSSYLGQDTEVKVSYCKNKIAPFNIGVYSEECWLVTVGRRLAMAALS